MPKPRLDPVILGGWLVLLTLSAVAVLAWTLSR